MGIKTEEFLKGDVYIDFPYEEVMFHFVKDSGKIFRKFYGDPLEDEVPHTSKLFAEAQIAGDLITAEQYLRGKEKRSL